MNTLILSLSLSLSPTTQCKPRARTALEPKPKEWAKRLHMELANHRAMKHVSDLKFCMAKSKCWKEFINGKVSNGERRMTGKASPFFILFSHFFSSLDLRRPTFCLLCFHERCSEKAFHVRKWIIVSALHFLIYFRTIYSQKKKWYSFWILGSS